MLCSLPVSWKKRSLTSLWITTNIDYRVILLLLSLAASLLSSNGLSNSLTDMHFLTLHYTASRTSLQRRILGSKCRAIHTSISYSLTLYRMIKQRGIDALINECLIGPVLGFGGTFVGYACGLLAYLYVRFTHPAYNADGSYTPVIVAFAFL